LSEAATLFTPMPTPAPPLRRAPCGGLHARVAGARVTLRLSGAAWLVETEALVVADLHLEKGSAYAARGQMLPPYDTRDTLRRLEAEVAALRPAILIFLGDSFHDRAAEARLDPHDAGRIAALADGRRLIWVVGNHDADGPRALPGEVVGGLTLGPLTLVHEPSQAPARGELAGHLHPASKVRGHARSVRTRCFLTDGERLILPAFGAYAGGLNVRDRAFAPLFGGSPTACALGRSRVHALSWDVLIGD
jgi:DNA ligase-associated metallophosphoesterase